TETRATDEVLESRPTVEDLSEQDHCRPRADQLKGALHPAPALRGPGVPIHEGALALHHGHSLGSLAVVDVGHAFHRTPDLGLSKPASKVLPMVSISQGQAGAPSKTAPESRRRWASLLVVCIGVMMVFVNASSTLSALPYIQDALHVSGSTLVWIPSAFTL